MNPGPPRLLLVVDTEEEFDWGAPFDRARTGVEHLLHVGRLQAVCEAWGIRPVYVVTYPVATQRAGVGSLGPLAEAGRAFIGAHLHPWVTPPYEEDVTGPNSFPGNLPEEQEGAKLAVLADAIERGFGARPVMYKAGRYGIGRNSFRLLEQLGFTVDLSPAPPFDYTREAGPDFSGRGLDPRWEGPEGRVYSIPGTGALVGQLPSSQLYAAAQRGRRFRLPGILARLGVVERIKLSPEGHTAAEMIRLVRFLHGRGTKLFSLSLHSPSVEAGHTPYARTEAEVQDLLRSLDDFLRFFMQELGGTATDPLTLRAEASASR